MVQVHGTCVAIDGCGVLLRGPPGSGKSDLALRLIDGGARLIADDRTEISLREGRPVVNAPPEIAGLIEVRGLGVLELGHLDDAVLGLVVELVADGDVERMPAAETCDVLDIAVPLLKLAPFHASAPAKVRLAARHATKDMMPDP